MDTKIIKNLAVHTIRGFIFVNYIIYFNQNDLK